MQILESIFPAAGNIWENFVIARSSIVEVKWASLCRLTRHWFRTFCAIIPIHRKSAPKYISKQKFQQVKRTSFEFFSGEFSTFFAEICGECCPIITLKESVGKFFGLACIKSYDYCNAFPAVCTALRIPSFPSSIRDLHSRSAWAQNRFAKSVSFVVSLPVYSNFTRSYSLVRSITVFDSTNPDSWWAWSCNT